MVSNKERRLEAHGDALPRLTPQLRSMCWTLLPRISSVCLQRLTGDEIRWMQTERQLIRGITNLLYQLLVITRGGRPGAIFM